jgi:hypothetical protein
MMTKEKPTAAFVLSLIGGIFILLGTFFYIFLFYYTVTITQFVGNKGDSYASLTLVVIGITGLTSSILVIVGANMINSGEVGKVRKGGILVLIFSIISLIPSYGGLIIGFILSLIGGILALTWKPKYLVSIITAAPSTIPQSGFVTQRQLQVPVSSGGSPQVTPFVDLDFVSSLRNVSLEGLVSGYGCESSKLFKVNFIAGFVPKEFEGVWDCCLLGCGGWGCAYLCIRGNEKIVVKVPRGFESVIEGGIEAPTGHEILLKKIKSEAEIMSSLNHPNIIKLLGVSNRVPLIIYEFADYGSLYWQLNKGWRPSLRDVIMIGIQLGDALRYIHYRGLIHGDIKPSNVFIKDKIAKLGDFSSTVKLLSSVSISKMVYTIGFRAPEQVYLELKKKAMGMGIENRIDIYQIGNLLLYILTGESIDGEEAINDKLVMDKLNGISNEDLKQILAKALALEPAKRPSAEDLTKMLYTVWNKV